MNVFQLLPALNCSALACAGGLLLFKKKNIFTHRLLGLLLLLLCGVEFSHVMVQNLPQGNAVFWELWMFRGMILVMSTGLLFSLVFLRENAIDSLRRSAWYIVIQVLAGVAFWSGMFQGTIISGIRTVNRGYGFGIGQTGQFFLFYLLISGILILLNFENTYRSAQGGHRRKVAATLGLMSVIVGLYVVLSSIALLFTYIDTRVTALSSLIVFILVCISLAGLRRRGITDERVRVGRQVLYTSATLIIAGVYLFVIGLFTKVFIILGFNMKTFLAFLAAFAVCLIFLFLIFSPVLKRRIQLFIDRSFYKSSHDFRREWSTVSEQVGTILDLGQLRAEIKRLVGEVMNVISAEVLLCAHGARSTGQCPEELQEWLVRYGGAVSAGELREINPRLYDGHAAFMEKYGADTMIALMARQQCLGVLLLGRKKDGSALSMEDRDLLKNISRQASISVLNARLSEELIVAREMEQFNKFSSFLIHDLKNCISMLSMVIQNAKTNFDNPEFQKATLTTLSGTISRMNTLMRKFTTIPEELVLRKRREDLNIFLERIITQVFENEDTNVKMFKYFNPVPVVDIDEEYLGKVFINLLINAREAMPRGGNLILRTDVKKNESALPGSYAAVSITDTGVGMSGEFIDKKLFRPFQSSKRKGIGLGLYQCRIIVEAHGGRIEVESEEGKGTTFTVKLPIGAREIEGRGKL